MLYHPKRLYLLALLPTALAGKSADVTKTFKFTDAFFIKFDPLSTAIGPDNVGVLMSALDGFAKQFKEVWTEQIESTLQGGDCTVNQMKLPEFSMCDWKYPNLYDVDELPTPGQCYEYENGFVQRIYYKINKLEITCPEDFKYKDLDKDAYTEFAFSGQDFLNIINPPDTECDGNESTCLFATADTAEWSSSDVCTAGLFVNRFIEIPVYLKCLDYTDGYGPKVANKLIKALDKYFELEVSKVLSEKIMVQAPEGFIYNFASPYASDRQYCGHGSYYAGGSLTNQVSGEDGILTTKFTYGFDVIWYKPQNFGRDELLEDEDVSSIISSVFQDGDFLSFLRQEYSDYEFIQNIDECNLIDPSEIQGTFAPTEEPTYPPTETPSASPVLPIIITSEPTISPSTTMPTLSPSLKPVTQAPTISNPPSKFIEPSAPPSHTSMPSSVPTPLPSTRLPTLDPTALSTFGNSDTEGSDKTLSPTPLPTEAFPVPSTPSPTCPNCIIHPDDLEEDECPIATTGTCGGGDRGDGICPYAGYCCSKWGYCGTSAEHCKDDSVAPTPSNVVGAPASPTYSKDAGQCADGKEGDGFCPDESSCCSDWGYCGSGEQYCFTTRSNDEDGESDDGTCGGGGVGDGTCKDGLCCSKFGFCGEGELYCTGLNDLQQSDASADEAEKVINNSPLPDDFKPEFGFRCGVTEVDARSNCKSECTHLVQCAEGEECWGIQLNYCNTFEEGTHPVCTDLDLADSDSRCGYDETSARGHCGPKCNMDGECGVGEFCFPTMLNLCECHEESCPEESAIAFSRAKALISPYFVESDPMNTSMDNSVEGKPRNSSFKSNLSVSTSLLLVFAFLVM
mmetsp:Transcript_27216/g.58314  ORF Transcript_27216/g.58314 Transcript_27216/m.58314 type:complete len:849 (+) Transcript_27216:279-2825(+)